MRIPVPGRQRSRSTERRGNEWADEVMEETAEVNEAPNTLVRTHTHIHTILCDTQGQDAIPVCLNDGEHIPIRMLCFICDYISRICTLLAREAWEAPPSLRCVFRKGAERCAGSLVAGGVSQCNWGTVYYLPYFPLCGCMCIWHVADTCGLCYDNNQLNFLELVSTINKSSGYSVEIPFAVCATHAWLAWCVGVLWTLAFFGYLFQARLKHFVLCRSPFIRTRRATHYLLPPYFAPVSTQTSAGGQFWFIFSRTIAILRGIRRICSFVRKTVALDDCSVFPAIGLGRGLSFLCSNDDSEFSDEVRL